jgi:saccharopine dehydrogenase-like NADP-dependent oxidoreductase
MLRTAQPGGNVGSSIITQLNKDQSDTKITAITRQSSPYTAPPDSNITHKAVDYDSFDSLVDAFTGQDAVVDCVTGGATQWDPSKRIIDAAIAAGVKFFFANESSSGDCQSQLRVPSTGSDSIWKRLGRKARLLGRA